MVGFSKKKKSSKLRGTREMGRGKKAGRGAGLRGGRGNAGAHKHKRVFYFSKLTDGDYWGRERGFKRPEEVLVETQTVNVGDLDQNLERWMKDETAKAHIAKRGDVTEVNLTALGFDKLLGSGKVTRKYAITVESAVARAVEKVQAAGGSVATSAAPEA